MRRYLTPYCRACNCSMNLFIFLIGCIGISYAICPLLVYANQNEQFIKQQLEEMEYLRVLQEGRVSAEESYAKYLHLVRNGSEAQALNMADTALKNYTKYLRALDNANMPDHVRDYLAHMNYDQTASLYRIAEIAHQASSTASRLGDHERELEFNAHVISAGDAFYARGGSSKHNHAFAMMYFPSISRDARERPRLMMRIQKVIVLANKGHGVPSGLREVGIQLLESHDANDIELARDILHLVINLEKEWFPDAYEKHVNYQWSLLGIVQAHLALGNIDSATQTLNEANALTLRGDYLQSVAQSLSDRLAREGGVEGNSSAMDTSDRMVGNSHRAVRAEHRVQQVAQKQERLVAQLIPPDNETKFAPWTWKAILISGLFMATVVGLWVFIRSRRQHPRHG